MNRIDKKFKELRGNGNKAMIPFITAGDPCLEETLNLVMALEKAGADIIELGIPYSDPIADGPVIQGSSARALNNGTKIKEIMETAKKIREQSNVPLVYLVYYNSIFKYGMEKFIEECSNVGIDGLIIPDLPIEERNEMGGITEKHGVYLIPLVAPTSKDRIEKIVKEGKGFVYCVAVKGVTGVRGEIETNIEEYMGLVNTYTDLPKAIGFGISSKEMAREFAKYCDGVIVGSALVTRIAEGESLEQREKIASEFIRDIKEGIQ